MSIEVEITEQAASDSAPITNVPALPSSTPRPPIWRRRSYQVASALVVVALIAGFVGNNFLAGEYTPAGTVRQYLGALQSGDANTAWAVLQVSAPTQPAAFTLTDKVSLQKALAAGRPDIKSFVVDSTTEVSSITSKVDFTYATASGSKQGELLVEKSGENHFLLYQGWRVLVAPTLLQLSLPNGVDPVSIDGTTIALPAGKSIVAVLPVFHKIAFGGSQMLAAQKLSVDAFFSLGQSVAIEPTLTSAGSDHARAAIKAYFANCAKQTGLSPDGCPQSYESFFATSTSWQVVGDPTQDLSLGFDQNLDLTATGHFQMVISYQESGLSGTGHDISAGGYRAALALTSSDVSVTSLGSDTSVGPLMRPAGATDQAAEQLVAQAIAACANVKSVSPADCPQGLITAVGVGPSWTLSGDPLSGATVTYDQATGIFTVHGSFNMTVTYSINGYPTSGTSYYDHYYAKLLWNGQALQLITIGGAFS